MRKQQRNVWTLERDSETQNVAALRCGNLSDIKNAKFLLKRIYSLRSFSKELFASAHDKPYASQAADTSKYW